MSNHTYYNGTDIWSLVAPDVAIIIPTNGMVNVVGEAIMGCGLALAAKQRHPELPSLLAKRLLHDTAGGNHPFFFRKLENILTFPTKHLPRDPKADWGLVMQSAEAVALFWELCELSREDGEPDGPGRIYKIACPKVGAGAGKLNWKFVRQGLEEIWSNHKMLDQIIWVE